MGENIRPFLDTSIPDEKKHLAVKAYRLTEISLEEKNSLISEYKNLIKTRWIIPTHIWGIATILGIAFLFLGFLFSWLPKIGLAFIIISGLIISYRQGHLEGFNDGNDIGRADGICKILGIARKEKHEYFSLARNLITEFKVETGDINAELGKS